MRVFDSFCSEAPAFSCISGAPSPTAFNGLGWDWDLQAMTWVCPEGEAHYVHVHSSLVSGPSVHAFP
jgi:hypothetical protein